MKRTIFLTFILLTLGCISNPLYAQSYGNPPTIIMVDVMPNTMDAGQTLFIRFAVENNSFDGVTIQSSCSKGESYIAINTITGETAIKWITKGLTPGDYTLTLHTHNEFGSNTIEWIITLK